MNPRVALIGALGNRGHALLQVLENITNVVALVDPSITSASHTDKPYQRFSSVEDLLKHSTFDVAVISVPHYLHFPIAKILIEHGKPIIKEKPFAAGAEEAYRLLDCAHTKRVPVFTITQRRDHPLFLEARAALGRIGSPYYYNYSYYHALDKATTGWRSKRLYALRGVGLDMGYHIFDVLLSMFGRPSQVACMVSYCFESTRQEQLEDFFAAQLYYNLPQPLVGTVAIGRHHINKFEQLEVMGDKGILSLTPMRVRVCDLNGSLVFEKVAEPSENQYLESQISMFLQNLYKFDFALDHMLQHVKNMEIIQLLYESAGQRNYPT